MPSWPLFIAIAFLAGSVPFGYLIGKARGVDLRTVGSKNIGATNLGRTFGRKYFFLCFFLDMLKGLIPTAAAGASMGLLGEFTMPADQAWWWLAVMAAAVLGHMYTPWLGFRGGKGVATGLGAMLGLFPALAVPAAGTLVVFLIVLALWRYVSAASIAGAGSLPFWVWYTHQQHKTLGERRVASQPGFGDVPARDIDAMVPFGGWPFVLVAAALGILVIYKHRTNIARLASGTELKIGGPSENASEKNIDPEAPAPGNEGTPDPPQS
ncbi:MAG: glycerol-3-phosphate 1-O-acyltransferase PlsY [Planctomycetota bacterium]